MIYIRAQFSTAGGIPLIQKKCSVTMKVIKGTQRLCYNNKRRILLEKYHYKIV